jgi:hypothetical protein
MNTYNKESVETLAHATALIGETPQNQEAFLNALAVSMHDTVSLDARESGGIKEVRDFANQLLLSPQFGAVRLGIIFYTEKLTPQAQNALLKILEEPPQRVKIVLFMTAEASVLPTVLSRCRRYYGTGKQIHDSIIKYKADPLEQFLAADTLAKDEALPAIVASWLSESYTRWCAIGRPVEGLSEVIRFWRLYQGLEAQTNKRLLLEQIVVSSV